MGEDKITIQEACKILHRSEKQVRRHIKTGRLSAELGQDGKYYILRSDVEAMARHPDRMQVDKVASHIERLDRRIAEIESRLDTLAMHVDEIIDALYAMPEPLIAPQLVRTPTHKTKPSQPHSTAIPELPEGTISLKELAEELGIGRTTLLPQIMDNGLEHIAIPLRDLGKPGAGYERYFTPEQAQAVREWRATRPTHKKPPDQ